MKSLLRVLPLVLSAMGLARVGSAADQFAVTLPPGVKAVWDLDQAYRETTPTRERICINGLWRWQPAASGEAEKNAAPPTGKWGYQKVPGVWPGSHDYMSRDTDRVYPHPDWASAKLTETKFAWYEREIVIPADWKGRDIFVDAAWVQSSADVFVDGKRAGNIPYPGGKVNVTALCKPGRKQILSIWVAALPLSAEMTSYSHWNVSATAKATVTRRGLAGDVFLEGVPAGARLGDVKIAPSVRKWELGVDVGVANLAADRAYRVKGELFDGEKKVHSFESRPFMAADATDGRFVFATPWKPEKLWDTSTPGNLYRLQLTLTDGEGREADTLPAVRFGFREFWVDGRDFRLNGTRFHANVSPYEGVQMSTYNASYAGAKESFLRLKEAGFNMVYSHHYNSLPGSHLAYEEVLRAADDTGMLFSFALPNAWANYQQFDKATQKYGVKEPAFSNHVAYYIGQAANHPTVVLYAINHNSFSYSELLNPALMYTYPDYISVDPKHPEVRTDRDGKFAQLCEQIIHRFDRSRPVYNHGGSAGAIISPNCYLDFTPIQEVSDYFGTWSAKSARPLFLGEYGTPVDADYTMFRGFQLDDKGQVVVNAKKMRGPSHFYGAWLRTQYHTPGWGSSLRGDAAYDITDQEKADLRFEAGQWRKHAAFQFWQYPVNFNNAAMVAPNIREVQAMYVQDNWPAFRTLGVSAICTWYYGELFHLRPAAERHEQVQTHNVNGEELASIMMKVDWDHLQRPGYSPDWQNAPERSGEVGRPYSHSREAWAEQPYLGKAWLRVTRPALAYLAGKAAHVTGKDHNFYPGETVEKQIVVINDSRLPLKADCQCTVALPIQVETAVQAPGFAFRPQFLHVRRQVAVETGEQARVPVKFTLPENLTTGEYEIVLTAKFDTGEVQQDRFAIHVLPRPAKLKPARQISLFDPAGMTKKVLAGLGVPFTEVAADAKLGPDGLLVIGKNALTIDGPAPDVSAVRDGLRVVVFEQNAAALEWRLGFRRQEFGLRNLFPRIPNHPLLAGLHAKNFWNWRGESGADMSPLEKLYYSQWWKFACEMYTEWCGLNDNRLWRSTTYGTVASILIETPAVGDFLPILEGGFALQYAPLMEYREGRGMVLFCQLDVSNREEAEPAAETLVHNILQYAGTWQPTPQRKARYAGDAAGKAHLEKVGIAAAAYEGGPLTQDEVLVVGPGVGKTLGTHAAAIAAWLKQGGRLVAIGLTEEEANSFLPWKVSMKTAEHISTSFPAQDEKSPFAGISPAGVHSREPRQLPLVVAGPGVEVLGDGVLARVKDANVVFCQIVPWTYDWQTLDNVKTTFRHSTTLLSRLLANQGVRGATPLLARFAKPADKDVFSPDRPKTMWLDTPLIKAGVEARWREGLYLDTPTEGDDPYRYYCW